MAQKVSDDVMFRIIDDVLAKGNPQTFSKDENYALTIYTVEKCMGGDLRIFSHNFPQQYATLAGVAANFLPGARSAHELSASESELVMALRLIQLQHGLQHLSEVVEQSEKEKHFKSWL